MKFVKYILLVAFMLAPLVCPAGQDASVHEVVTLKEKDPPGGLAFSADGTRLIALAGSYPDDGHVWAWRDAKVVARLPQAHIGSSAKRPIGTSPDGKYWAVCGRGVTIWDARSWQPVVIPKGKFANDDASMADLLGCRALVFSADGKQMIVARFSARTEPRIVAYDTRNWQRLWSLVTSPFSPENLALSPDGKLLAISGTASNITAPRVPLTPGFETQSFSQGYIALVDLDTQKIARTIPIEGTDYTSSADIAWSLDSKTITVGAGAALRTYAVSCVPQDAALLAENKFARPRLFASPDGKYRIVTDLGERHDVVRVFDVSGPAWKILHEIHARPMHLAWAPDSRHFALSGAARSLASLIPYGDLLMRSSGKIIVYEIR